MAKAQQVKKEPMGFVCCLLQEDGSAIPFEALGPEEREAWRQRSAARLGEAMSDYFTQHPEEYARLTAGEIPPALRTTPL